MKMEDEPACSLRRCFYNPMFGGAELRSHPRGRVNSPKSYDMTARSWLPRVLRQVSRAMHICDACMYALHIIHVRTCARTLKSRGPHPASVLARGAGSQRKQKSFPALWCLLRGKTCIYFHAMRDRRACVRARARMRARACARMWKRDGQNAAAVFVYVRCLYTAELIILTLRVEEELACFLPRCSEDHIVWRGRAMLITAGQSQVPKMLEKHWICITCLNRAVGR